MPEGLRADARRSREALITAFTELLGERRDDIPLYAVGRRAGVGQGTLYRHFPDRAALAAAAFGGQLDELEQQASARPDDPEVFFALLTAAVENQIGAHGLMSIVLSGADSDGALQRLTDRTRLVFAGPASRAAAAGLLREDFDVADALTSLSMIDGVLNGIGAPEERAASARRALVIVLDGLRAPGAQGGARGSARGEGDRPR